MKNLLNKEQGFTLIELMIVVAIIGVLVSIVIPAYQDHMIKAKWGKTIAGVRALKLAVENCLSDSSGAFNQCDTLSDLKIGAYGVTQYATANGEFLSIELISDTAAIKITGDAALSNCVLTLNPSFTKEVGMIMWSYTITGTSSLADTEKCRAFVKDS